MPAHGTMSHARGVRNRIVRVDDHALDAFATGFAAEFGGVSMPNREPLLNVTGIFNRVNAFAVHRLKSR